MGDWEYNNLMHELRQGMELARKLQNSLHVPCSSQESHELVIQKIIATFERALRMVNTKLGQPSSQVLHSIVAMGISQPPPLSTENLDQHLREINGSSPKKRRTIPTWTKLIRVIPGMELEGPLDDGYSWRKYGQKGIHGAKYPRGYYRCAQRNVQGCMATKQVQRSDQDPTIFEINYSGNHTCTMASNEVKVPLSASQENQEQINLSRIPQQQPSDELLMNLRAGMRVITESLDQSSLASSFHYLPSTSTIKSEQQAFPSSTNISENLTFPSSTSPSGYPKFASSGLEINDMISAVTSASTSLTLASLNFPFDHSHLLESQYFTFDNPPFSSG